MTQKEEQLLWIALCAMSPYGVKVALFGWNKFPCTITKIDVKLKKIFCPEANCYQSVNVVKPYLRPMSSMTEEEKYIYRHMLGATLNSEGESIMFVYEEDFSMVMDWLNKNHFDYRGLIEKGLALEAPEGMYKTK